MSPVIELEIKMDADLIDSWEIALRAERLAPGTIRTYTAALRSLEGPLTRGVVQRWVVGMLDAGLSASTASQRLTAVKTYCRWAVDEGEMDAETAAGIRGIKAPKVDVPVISPLTDDELKRLLATCGPDFGGVRDRALLSFMLETGARSGEAIGLRVGDVDARRGIAVIRRGKGGAGRVVPFSPQCARALDRYLRLRKSHSKALTSDAMWLGVRGRSFSYGALWLAFKARAERAGLDDFNPHKLRHTAAVRWLRAGGSEGGLRAVAGWTAGSQMMSRYVGSAASELAVTEAGGLGLGLG